jgi:hypothetical protein
VEYDRFDQIEYDHSDANLHLRFFRMTFMIYDKSPLRHPQRESDPRSATLIATFHRDYNPSTSANYNLTGTALDVHLSVIAHDPIAATDIRAAGTRTYEDFVDQRTNLETDRLTEQQD